MINEYLTIQGIKFSEFQDDYDLATFSDELYERINQATLKNDVKTLNSLNRIKKQFNITFTVDDDGVILIDLN